MQQEAPKPMQPLISKQQVPQFVIPPRYQGRHLKKNSLLLEKVTDQFTDVKSNEFMCNSSGQSTSQNRHLIRVHNQKICESSSGKPLFYDPGLSSGMTLKHVPMTTSSYGFPMLEAPACWKIDEAMFHQNKNSYNSNRKRGDAFNCAGFKTNSRHSLSVPSGETNGPQMSTRAHGQRNSCPALIRKRSTIAANDIGRNDTTGHQKRFSCPSVTHRNSTTAATDIEQNQLLNSSVLAAPSAKRPAPVVYSNLKKDVICSPVEEQISSHSIDFSCSVTTEGIIQVTIHSVHIPSNPSVNESRVCVKISNPNIIHFRSRKCSKWTPSASDEILFGDKLEFKHPSKSADKFLHFKVMSRKQGTRACRGVGSVMIPIPDRKQTLKRFTRLLEATSEVGTQQNSYSISYLLAAVTTPSLSSHRIVTG